MTSKPRFLYMIVKVRRPARTSLDDVCSHVEDAIQSWGSVLPHSDELRTLCSDATATLVRGRGRQERMNAEDIANGGVKRNVNRPKAKHKRAGTNGATAQSPTSV